jgi:glycolate oxidase
MTDIDKFLSNVQNEFPDDRLTYQKAIPTFHPESADEAANFLKLANRCKQGIYITGFGNNIDPIDSPFNKMVSIRTDRLNKIIEIVPEDFYITVGAGYPLREINIHLAKRNLWLPHSSLSYVGSVGGALSAGLTAKYDIHDLPLKKYFIKAEIVTPQGEIITPGSTCFKSVSGYDIVKIFFGSWGLLGLIVSATFRVMPESGAEDYGSITLNGFDRSKLIDCLDENNKDNDAVYSRKVKEKFDPNNVLPIV